MRWIIILMVLLFLPSAAHGLNVVVSLPDFETIVKEVGGNDINTSVILPPEQTPIPSP